MSTVTGSDSRPPPHMFAVAPLRVWWRLIRDSGGIPRPYRGRLGKVLATSFATAPLRVMESLYSIPALAGTRIGEPPVYIQGYARSGTTYTHNLMAQDPGFGYVSTFQAAASPMFLIGRGWLDRMIAKRLPKKRPMDDMAMSLNLPLEEDVAVAGISHLSPTHFLSFPQRGPEFMEKFARMRLSEKELAEWERAYMTVLRKATLASGGRRLVLKGPASLGRTPALLRLFPDAKFVHVVRNPWIVYLSAIKLYRTMVPMFQLTPVDWNVVDAALRQNYVTMMRRYMRHRDAIPEGNLVEVRFEDILQDPLGEFERIYARLGLRNWARARAPMAAYLQTLAGYRQSRYRFDRETIDIVGRHWGFAAREWGYEPPRPDASPAWQAARRGR